MYLRTFLFFFVRDERAAYFVRVSSLFLSFISKNSEMHYVRYVRLLFLASYSISWDGGLNWAKKKETSLYGVYSRVGNKNWEMQADRNCISKSEWVEIWWMGTWAVKVKENCVLFKMNPWNSSWMSWTSVNTYISKYLLPNLSSSSLLTSQILLLSLTNFVFSA